MEFLRQVKTPSSGRDIFGKIPIRKETRLSEENGERLLNFLALLDKNISSGNLKIVGTSEIGKAEKTAATVVLEQLTEREIIEIKNSKMNLLAEVEEKPSAIRATKEDKIDDDDLKPVAKKRETEILAISNTGFESEFEMLKQFKHYLEDDKIFKIPLKQSYTLNSRKRFFEEVRKMIVDYLNRADVKTDAESSCDATSSKTGFNPLIHQELVKQYMNSYSPYRGVLLYHGLGSGKTCTSIGVIEAMKTTKPKIFIMTPASLQNNYKSQLKFCGSSLFNEDGDWEYVEYPTDSTREQFIKDVRVLTRLPMKYLNSKNGVYLLRKEPRAEGDFSVVDKAVLSEQIDMMIRYRFHFISYNGLTMKSWLLKYKTNQNINPFDNSVVVIDEGHNFVSRIINKLNIGKSSVSVELYEHLLSAENCNVVLLSGTPLINYPSELGVLFNLVGGSHLVIELKCRHTKKSMMQRAKFKEVLAPLGNIDYIKYIEATNTLRIMKNPYGFVRSKNNKVIFDPNEKMTNLDFKDEIEKLLHDAGYKTSVPTTKDGERSIALFKKFPDTEESFNKIFVDKKDNGLKNKSYFQSKIAGLVSYVGDKKELMPKIVLPSEDSTDEMFIEKIEMGEYAMSGYNAARSLDAAIDNNAAKKKKGKDQQASSYKIFSRAACNFVFPSGFSRPMPSKQMLQDIDEDDIEALTDKEMLTMNDGKYDTSDIELMKDKKVRKNRQIFVEQINELIAKITREAYKYFESDLPKQVLNRDNMKILIDPEYEITDDNDLSMYSPKFYRILKNILDEDNEGLHLMYSNFRTLEGIGLFKIILEYYGYSEFRLTKTDTGTDKIYNINVGNAFYNHRNFEEADADAPIDTFTSLKGRKFYALYTGKESDEEKEIIRNIYNGNFDKIPFTVKEDISRFFFDGNESKMTNKMGEIINLLMISSSGAEGIDLKNVRFVHLTEPYWHPVRIEQVIGRAKRICSHKDLPPELQNVKVFMYLLTYNKNIIKEKESLYTQLINQDRDKDGEIRTTDEKLFNIMKKKQKLMREFLTAIKEASVDCFYNHEDNEKCLSFPLPKTPIDERIYDIDYTQDARQHTKTTTIKSKKKGILEDPDDEGDAEKKVEARLKKLKIQKDDGTMMTVAVDISVTPRVAYDYETYKRAGKKMRIGVIRTKDKLNYLDDAE